MSHSSRRNTRIIRWFLAGFLAVIAAAAAAPVAAQTAIVGGSVHPIDGEPIERGVVVVAADGTIAAVGGPDTDIPTDAEIVEAEGKTITPGLIDARTRLGLVEIWAVPGTRDHEEGGKEQVHAAFRAADGFNSGSTAIPVTRTGGVTSAVIVPGGGLVSGQSAWVDLVGAEHDWGRVSVERVGMHFSYSARRPGRGIRSRGAILETFRELYDDVTFFQNNRADFDANRARELVASRSDLMALEQTLEAGMPSVFNVHRASDIRTVLDFTRERGLDPVVTGGVEAWMVADELAARDVPVVINPVMNLPTSFETLGARTETAALLEQAGVPVVLSTFGAHNVRKLRQLAGNAVRAGMSHQAALRAVTLNPARAFGLEDQYGSLEAGKWANVVVWSGDPFELSTRVERMWVRGESVSLESRQQKLFERYRRLERRGEPAERP
jgi:imidazolonepropionase-like amidohydrolase